MPKELGFLESTLNPEKAFGKYSELKRPPYILVEWSSLQLSPILNILPKAKRHPKEEVGLSRLELKSWVPFCHLTLKTSIFTWVQVAFVMFYCMSCIGLTSIGLSICCPLLWIRLRLLWDLIPSLAHKPILCSIGKILKLTGSCYRGRLFGGFVCLISSCSSEKGWRRKTSCWLCGFGFFPLHLKTQRSKKVNFLLRGKCPLTCKVLSLL